MAKKYLESIIYRLRNALSAKEFIIIVCSCEVDYVGRAKSFLERGERTIIIKEDTSFLIHRPIELEPVNWQPPPNYIGIAADKDHAVLTVKRVRKPEKLVVRIYGVRSFFSGRLQDKGGFHMYLTEKEISETICRNPELVEEGFRVTSSEMREESGIIDVVGVDRNGRRTIVEIKKDRASIDAAKQVLRYFRSLGDSGIRAMLLAPGATVEAQRLLKKSGVEFKKLNMVELTRIFMYEKHGQEGRITGYFNSSEP